jgi:hypothetical protein
MGLDYSYMLYFPQDRWFEVLQKVIRLAKPLEPPTRLVFPDHEILVPMETWVHNSSVVYADGDELEFCTALYFEEDDEIRDYRESHRYPDSEEERCPPVMEKPARVSIGYIYLSIHKEPSRLNSPNELDRYCLFEFGTPGTTMSLLFDYSSSIRKTFVGLLDSVPGICGVFNREDTGVVFWWQGKQLDDIVIDDIFLPPVEIEKIIKAENNPK